MCVCVCECVCVFICVLIDGCMYVKCIYTYTS